MAWDSIADSLIRATSRAFSSAGTITYTPTGGVAVDLSGRSIFTAAHEEEVLDDNTVAVQTVKPTLDLRLADLPVPPAEDDLVVVRGVAHKVAAIEVDGEGGALVALEELAV